MTDRPIIFPMPDGELLALVERANHPPARFQRGEITCALRRIIEATPPGGAARVPLPTNEFWRREFYRRAAAQAHFLWGAGAYRISQDASAAIIVRAPGRQAVAMAEVAAWQARRASAL